jgi:hypothetical protein
MFVSIRIQTGKKQRNTYINREVQKVERARVRLSAIVARGSRQSRSLCLGQNIKLARRQHRHENVGEMKQHRAKHLLAHVEEPDLQRAPGVFAQPLDSQR